MKPWHFFVIVTILCWGAYVPTLHHGQLAFGRNSALRAFLCVGTAYLLVSIVVLAYLFIFKAEPVELNGKAISWSTIAGVLGAIGALGIVFAMKTGGKPILVAPLVFAGAPVVNTIVSMLWSKPEKPPGTLFYAGIAFAALGAVLVLRFRPT